MNKKFFRRFLPFVLSVAMMVEMIPTTAFAAELPTVAEEVTAEADGAVAEESVTAVSDAAEQKDDETGSTEPVEVIEAVEEVEETLDKVEISTQNDGAAITARIVVDETRLDTALVGGVTVWRKLEADGIALATTYADPSNCGNIQIFLMGFIDVEIDNKEDPTLSTNLMDALTYTWSSKAADGTLTPLGDAVPQDVGEYVLTVALAPEKVGNDVSGVLYDKVENLAISLSIVQAEVELKYDPDPMDPTVTSIAIDAMTVAPGTTAAKLKEDINKKYVIEYANGNNYTVDRSILKNAALTLNLFEVGSDGVRTEMKDEDKFDGEKDYVLVIGDTALTDNAAKNYKLNVKDYYVLNVGNRQNTQILYTRKDAGDDLVDIYAADKKWAIADVIKDLFAAEVTDAAGNVKKAGEPTVFAKDADLTNGIGIALKDAKLEAKWYTREYEYLEGMDSSTPTKTPVANEDAGEILETINATACEYYLYKPMAQDPDAAGEYYIIWSYAGEGGIYNKSNSAPIRFTVDPAPAVLQIEKEAVDGVDNPKGVVITEGMTAADVTKQIAKVTYGVYPMVKNETTGALEDGTTALTLTPEFFGTAYDGDDVNQNRLQYYVPEFVLQRRIAKIKSKGAAEAVKVDEKAVDWETPVYPVKTVVENKDFATDVDDWPMNVEQGSVESVEYEFRLFFTGNKVLYSKDGSKVVANSPIPITDLTTNGANRNYLIDIARDRLDKGAVAVTVKSAADAKIVTDDIVAAFIEFNKDSLDPQVDSASMKGTLENPAVKIYDQRSLFADRASYKKAKVKEDKEGGADITASPTDGRIFTYDWSYTTLQTYQNFLDKYYDEEQRNYASFEDYINSSAVGTSFWNRLGNTDPADGSLSSMRAPGYYRLLISYTDPEGNYKSTEEEVIFKVERQEIIIVAAEQYVKVGETVATVKGRLNALQNNTEQFTIYKLPHNSQAEFDALDAEAKKALVVPSEEEIAAYTAKAGKKPEMNFTQGVTNTTATYAEGGTFGPRTVTWKLVRKVKDAGTGDDTDEWQEVTAGTIEDDFTYGIVGEWEGGIAWLDNKGRADLDVWGWNLDTSRYTTQDVKTFRQTGEDKQHQSVSELKFYDKVLYAEADGDKIKALTHEYDGNAVDIAKVAAAITLYEDEALTQAVPAETAATFINTTDVFDPNKINIYWRKTDYPISDNGVGAPFPAENYRYANKDAIYGGEYTLMLYFAGGVLGAAPAEGETAPIGPVYAPLDIVNGTGTGWIIPNEAKGNGNATFTVTPHKITITPILKAEDYIKAGDTADTLLSRGITVEGLIEKDEGYFKYTEIAHGEFDVRVNPNSKNADGSFKETFAHQYFVDKDGGYPAFNIDFEMAGWISRTTSVPTPSTTPPSANWTVSDADYVIQVDDKDIKNPANTRLRYGKKYTAKLTNELASPLKESYSVTYKAASVTISKRGNAEITPITGATYARFSGSGITSEWKDGTYTIKPVGAVHFFYDIDTEITNAPINDRYGTDIRADKLANHNILGFRIEAPREFNDDWNDNVKNIIYKNAIYDAGGYILTDWTYGGARDCYYLRVIFPLTEEDKDKSFSITWEDGYTETFKLADLKLEADLTKAVAPKSIKFNNVAKKMAVGETQALDLKIVKAQLGDVINIRYRLKGDVTKNDYISIDPETGVVTALKAGKAANVIEAYPVYRDAKGNIQPIKDKKGKTKVATAKITVTEVSAAGIKKIVADEVANGTVDATVQFTVPDNGYRREFYVVDVTKGTKYANNKKWKAANFEKAIAEMQNGQWEDAGFAIEPEYDYDTNKNLTDLARWGRYDLKLKVHLRTLNLEPEHEYLIYVRNVSRARALDDGSVVSLSAAGSVKKYKATKSMVKSIQLDFTIKTGEKDKKNKVVHPVDEDGNVLVDEYEIELADKKTQLNVYGLFSDKYGGNDAAELIDNRRYSLVPTLKNEKAALKKYQTPKLQYAIFDDAASPVPVVGVVDQPFTPGAQQSKYATINKKGVITLKGTDLNGSVTLWIYVRDGAQFASDEYDYNVNGAGGMIPLKVVSKAYGMKAKKAKMKVGQTIRLTDYVQYTNNKKKVIPNYRSCGLTISEEVIVEAREKGFDIQDNGARGDERTHDWLITATAPSAKGGYSLKVTDYDAEGKEMTATVKLTASKMDGVKGLKVTYVDNEYITFTFSHASNRPASGAFANDDGSYYDYLLEVKDARGSIVDTMILPNTNKIDIDGIEAKQVKAAQSWLQYPRTSSLVNGATNKRYIDYTNVRPVANPVGTAVNYYTGAKTKQKVFAYTYHNEKLLQLSTYTLSVTPIAGDQRAAKAATTKAKTTNIPASRANIDLTGGDIFVSGIGTVRSGGRNLLIGRAEAINTVGAGAVADNVNITEFGRLVSGNTYTIKLGVGTATTNALRVDALTAIDPAIARDRVTDTLVWKSSNGKVAKIKAKPGTYTAALTAKQKGRTVITVSSKVTKKVIARWVVTVWPVEDGSAYAGNYEPTWNGGFYEKILALYDPDYEGRLEVLSENVPLRINAGENNPTAWVSFTAPHFGEYTLAGVPAAFDGNFYDDKTGERITNAYGVGPYTLFLEANQKIYFRVDTTGNVTLNMTGTELARLTKANTKENPLEVKAGYVAFTAWEENVYTFSFNGTVGHMFKDSSSTAPANAFGDGDNASGDGRELGMAAGETQYIYVNAEGKLTVTARQMTSIAPSSAAKIELDKDKQAAYVSYTANVTGRYGFTYDVVDGTKVTIIKADGSVMYYDSTATPSILSKADEEETKTNKETKVTTTTVKFNLTEGDRIVIAVEADPEITDALRKHTVNVSVAKLDTTAKAAAKEDGTISATVKRGTNDALVQFVIPSFSTAKARFAFVVDGEDGTAITGYYDADLNDISTSTTGLGLVTAAGELTVPQTYTKPNGSKATLKAGDTIYIKVKAAGDPDKEGQKDAELKVVPTAVKQYTAVPAGEAVEVTSETKQWYTFTAPKDGYYNFGVKVADRAEGDTTPTHNAVISIYKALFGTTAMTGYVNVTEGLLALKTGEQVAIQLNLTSTPDPLVTTDAEGKEQLVKSSVTVSVNEVTVKALALDKEEAVEILTTDDNKVRYYSFTAVMGDDYTLKWKPEDDKTDYAGITVDTSGIDGAFGGTTLGTMNAGKTYYIRVTSPATNKYDVKGNLKVTSDKRSAELIGLDEEKAFTLDTTTTADGIATKLYKFVVPADGLYAIITTPDKNESIGLDYPQPTKALDDDGSGYYGIGTTQRYATATYDKGQVIYLKLRYTAAGDVKETKGKITISLNAVPVSGDKEVKVADGVYEQYSYVIPKSGRYEFKADYDEDKATVTWLATDGFYYEKNTKISVTVEGKDKDAAAEVKLHDPALITPVELKAEEANQITAEAGKSAYYVLNCANPVVYDVAISDVAADKAIATLQYFIDNRNAPTNLEDGDTVEIDKKGTTVFVKATAVSAKKDADCKLTLKAVKELALGDNPVHLEAGETVSLIYRAKERGTYVFDVNKEGAELLLDIYGATQYGDKLNDSALLAVKTIRTYKLSNQSSSAIDFTVTMKRVTPIVLEPGQKSEEVTIPAGETAYFTLKTFKKVNYGILVADVTDADDKNKGKDFDSTYLLVKVEDNTPVTKTISRRADGHYIETTAANGVGGETLLTVKNTGKKDKKATVSLDQINEQKLTGEAITLAKNESKWITFVASEDNRYVISMDNKNVTMSDGKIHYLKPGKTTPSITNPSISYNGYYEQVLDKGDKLVYKLTYTAALDDENKPASQTVNVKIVPVTTTDLAMEADKTEGEKKETFEEKDVKTVWYKFTAKETGVYTFSTEDEYGNASNASIQFFAYVGQTPVPAVAAGKADVYLKAGETKFVKVVYALNGSTVVGSYVLRFKLSKTVTEAGAEQTLDFNYNGEVQELKFVAPKGGTYKISGHAIRGNSFTISVQKGTRAPIVSLGSDTGTDPEFVTSAALMKDDIVTIKVTSNQRGKASITLRIDEENTAESMTVGEELAGTCDVPDTQYSEVRITEEGVYAITASGDPTVDYQYVDAVGVVRSPVSDLSGTNYLKADKDSRIVFTIKNSNTATTAKDYKIKVEKLNVVSLDSNNEETKTLEYVANALYTFTTDEAYIQCKIPAGKTYYCVYTGITLDGAIAPATAKYKTTGDYGTLTTTIVNSSESEMTVIFKFTKAKANADKTASFRLVCRESVAGEVIELDGAAKAGTVAVNETIIYKFTAAEAGDYLFNFIGSNCTLSSSGATTAISSNSDGVVPNRKEHLNAGDVVTFTITSASGKGGSFKGLAVSKYKAAEMEGGKAAGTLAKGEVAYYEFTVAGAEEEASYYQIYGKVTDAALTIGYVETDENGDVVATDASYATYPRNAAGTAVDNQLSFPVPKKHKRKITFTLDAAGATGNAGYSLTVKEVAYTPVESGKAEGALEANEAGFCEFTATAENAIDHKVTVVDEYGDRVPFAIAEAAMGADGKLGAFGSYSTSDTFDKTSSLKKGDKLRIKVESNPAPFKFKVTVTTVAPLEYQTLKLDQKVTGQLYDDDEAGYDLTELGAAEASKGGTRYVIYYDGDADIKYTRYYMDGETEKADTPVSLSKACTYVTWNSKDVKIRFNITGPSSSTATSKWYSLLVKKADTTATALALDTKVNKTLKGGEEAVYEFTSGVTEDGGVMETYFVTASFDTDITVNWEVIERDSDGKETIKVPNTVITSSGSSSRDLKKGEIIRIKVTNGSATNKNLSFSLVVKKPTFTTVDAATPTPVTGRLDTAKYEYACYQYTCTDEAATDYEIYGTYGAASNLSYRKVTLTDGKLTAAGAFTSPMPPTLKLNKNETLQIIVSGQSDANVGYKMVLAKVKAPAGITVGTAAETGALIAGQSAYFTYKNTGTETATFTLDYPEAQLKDASISVSIQNDDGSTVYDSFGCTWNSIDKKYAMSSRFKSFDVASGRTVKVTLYARNDVSKLTFTLKNFKAEGLTLGELTANKSLAAGDTAYYEYTTAEAGKYILSVLRYDTAGGITLRINDIGMVSNVPNEITVATAGDVIKVDVTANAANTVKLLLQKEPEAVDTSWDGKLAPGAVKLLKYEVADSEAIDARHIVSLNGQSIDKNDSTVKYSAGSAYPSSWNVLNSGCATGSRYEVLMQGQSKVFWVANMSFSAAKEGIKFEGNRLETLALDKPASGDIATKERVYFKFPKAAVKENDVDEFAPYYLAKAADNDSDLSYSKDGMFTDKNNETVGYIENATAKTLRYSFALRSAWKGQITEASEATGTLAAREGAYYAVKAPADKALYVSVEGKNLTPYYGSTRTVLNNPYDSISVNTGIYYVPMGQTVYFNVYNNADIDNTYTLKVLDT